jgi:hypothetical protein
MSETMRNDYFNPLCLLLKECGVSSLEESKDFKSQKIQKKPVRYMVCTAFITLNQLNVMVKIAAKA